MIKGYINAKIELHTNPFLGTNTLLDVKNAMKETGINILALSALDKTIYPKVLEESKKYFTYSTHDKAGVKINLTNYLLNAREYQTKENLHVLTVGHSYDEATPKTEIRKIIDNGLKNEALVLLDHIFVDNTSTFTAGHISEDLERKVTDLCKEYPGQLAIELNGYCKPWLRKGLQLALNPFLYLKGKKPISYHDVNKKAERFAKEMCNLGYNIPIVKTTDLHGRNPRLLKAIGASRIETWLEGDTPTDIVQSLKKNIFTQPRAYENKGDYVDVIHFTEAFGIPMLVNIVKKIGIPVPNFIEKHFSFPRT